MKNLDTTMLEYKREVYDYSYGVRQLITCFKQKVTDDWYFTGEAHDFWEMVYVLEGTLWVSEEGRVYKLQSGDIIFHKPMEFHKLWCKDPHGARFQVISFAYSNADIESLSDDVYRLSLDSASFLEEVYTGITEAFHANIAVTQKLESERNRIREKLALLNLEQFLLMLTSKTDKSIEARQHTTMTVNYKLIMDTLQENLNYNLTIDDIAKLCNMSVSNLKKTFNKYGDGGIMHHFTRMKIQRATKFLTASRSIESVAHAFGFKSASHFSVAFKRVTGMTPSAFKKQR